MSDNSTNSPAPGQAGRGSSSEGCFSAVPTDVWQGCQKDPGCCQTHHVQPGYLLFLTAFPDLVETARLAKRGRNMEGKGRGRGGQGSHSPRDSFWDAAHSHSLQVGTFKRDALTGKCISASGSPPNRLFLRKHWQTSRRSMWDPTPPLENMRSPGSRGRRGD